MVLTVPLGPAGLREPIVDLNTTSAASPLQHAVDDTRTSLVLIEAKRQKVIQRARRLRDRETERVLHVARKRIGTSRFVGGSVPQKRDEIASGRQAERRDDGIFCRIHELVDMALLERCAGGKQPDRPVVDVFPTARGDRRRRVVEPLSNR